MHQRRHAALSILVLVAAAVAGCGSPPASRAPEPAPVVTSPPPAQAPAPVAAPSWSGAGPRLAARDPALERWKRDAAERIHAANAKQLFEGRPHHLLQGVIVADLTVDRSGQVRRLQIVRSPGLARLNNMVQASVKTASPLPAPPAALMKTGTMTYSETWLFTNDSRWRLRTLTLPQE
jgi:protein TonB